jgi:hypothetical protein
MNTEITLMDQLPSQPLHLTLHPLQLLHHHIRPLILQVVLMLRPAQFILVLKGFAPPPEKLFFHVDGPLYDR